MRTVSQAVRSQATVSIAHVERDVDRYLEVFDDFLVSAAEYGVVRAGSFSRGARCGGDLSYWT